MELGRGDGRYLSYVNFTFVGGLRPVHEPDTVAPAATLEFAEGQ